MNKRQVIQHAKEYMDLLSKGIDPISQKEVDPASIVAEPRLQKCFAFVSDLLEELLANDGHVALSYDGADAPPNASAPQYELVRKKDPFRLSQAQRGRVMIAKGPVTPITFVNHINRVIDSEAMEKLSIKSINTWLLKNEYISQTKQPAVITKTVIKIPARTDIMKVDNMMLKRNGRLALASSLIGRCIQRIAATSPSELLSGTIVVM